MRHHAELIDQLSKAGAKRIFVDVLFSGTTDKFNDEALAKSIARSGRVVLPVKVRSGPSEGTQQDSFPMPAFAKHAGCRSGVNVRRPAHLLWMRSTFTTVRSSIR